MKKVFSNGIFISSLLVLTCFVMMMFIIASKNITEADLQADNGLLMLGIVGGFFCCYVGELFSHFKFFNKKKLSS